HRFITAGQLPSGESFSSGEDSASASAYLLFTSGSTGVPKGVPINQGNVRSYVDYICRRYDVNEHDRFSQQFDLTFDLSAHDLIDRKSTRLNSSHVSISYAVFCLKKKKKYNLS